jgi:hypothetical protein
MGEEKQAKAIARVKVYNEFKFSFLFQRLIFFALVYLQAKYEWDLGSVVTKHQIELQNETKHVRCPYPYLNTNSHTISQPEPNPNLLRTNGRLKF